MVGGALAGIIRHQRHLVGALGFHECQETLVRIAFDVEFAARIVLAQQVVDVSDVGAADVALIRPGMNGDARRPRIQRHAAEFHDGWPWQIAAVTQIGDGVDVDRQLARHGEDTPVMGCF